MNGGDRQRLLDRLLGGGGVGPAPAVSTGDGGPAPLSFGQQRLWFLDSIDPTGSEYVTPIVLRLTGTLDTAALAGALHRVVLRHEVLRSRIELRGDTPVQETVEVPEWPLPVTSASTEEAARRRAVEMVNRPFDLSRGPMLRTELIRLGAEHWWLVIAVHHVAFDGWSRGIMLDDLATAYAAALAGSTPPERAAPRYAGYAAGQRSRVAAGHLDAHLDHWRDRLAGTAPLDLPTVHTRPPVRDPRGALAVGRLPPELTASVAAVAARFSMTPFMVQLAAYLVLLHRYSGQRDVTVAIPSAERGDPAWHGTVGFFVNTLPVRVRLDDRETVAELLRRVRGTVLDALAHQEVPFEHLVELVEAPRDPSRTPLCQVMFVQEEPAGAQLPRLAGLAVEEVEFDRGIARFDLTLAVRPDPSGGADVAVQYATSLFDAAFAERLLRHWEHLLRRLTGDPSTRVGRVEMLTAAERSRIVRRAAGPVVGYPPDRIEDLVARQVRRTPESVAVRFDGEELTFAELDRRSDALAARLRAAGVGPGAVVGVHQRRSLRLPVSVLAILKAGGAYLPLDPDLPATRTPAG